MMLILFLTMAIAFTLSSSILIRDLYSLLTYCYTLIWSVVYPSMTNFLREKLKRVLASLNI
jgi:hypothetical protein